MNNSFDDSMQDREVSLQWVRLGGIFGVAAMVDYTILSAVSLPKGIDATLAAAFGPLFSLASYGLYRCLTLYRKTASLQIAVIANAIAGALLTAMLLVQLAVRSGGHDGIDDLLWMKLRRIDLGLDVAWDVYGVLGTFLFAWNMLKHPRFGKIFGGLGLVFASVLAILNLATFPIPPANAGLVDVGPLVGLWYTAVSVQLLRSSRWAGSQMTFAAAAAP